MEKPPMRFNVLGFMALIGAGFGIAYGFVRSAHLSWYQMLAAMAVILLVQYLIWRNGKSASYANAQAWASAQVDVAVNASAQAVANARAMSAAFASAQATAIASAQASNSVILQLAALPTAELVRERVLELAKTSDDELENLLKTELSDYNKSMKSIPGVKPVFVG